MDARDPLIVGVDRAYGFDRGDLPGGGAVAARRGGVVFVAAVGVFLAGCSSSGARSLATTVASSAPPTNASTVAPTPVTTATPTSTSTTTTSAPTTTTIDPKVTADAAVKRAIVLAEDTFSACLVALPHCDPQTLAVARTGQLLARNVALINDWNAKGFAVREREKFRYVIESVTLAENSVERATAVVCIADGSIRVRPGAGPGGADMIVDDSFISGRDSLQMRIEADGRWKVYDGPSVGPGEATDICP